MELRSVEGTVVRRLIFIIVIALCVYKFEVNQVFFGFWIVIFSFLFFLSGSHSLRIDDDEIVVKFKRLLPVISQTSKIKYKDIIDVHYSERKLEPMNVALNVFIAHAPSTSMSGGLLTIVEKGGEKHQIGRIGSENKFQKAVALIKSKTTYF